MQLKFLEWVQSFHNPFLDRFFEIITISAEEGFIILIAACILWTINKRFGYRIGFAVLTSFVLNGILKNTFKVPRPNADTITIIRGETATGHAFPSGHTQGGAAFWTSLMTYIRHKKFIILGSTMIILVGFSRLYLGVHWPTDVIGGIVIGITWVLIANQFFDYSERTNRPWMMVILGLFLTIGIFFFQHEDYVKALGSMYGFFLGYYLETLYIKHDVRHAFKYQVVKMIVGITILLVIQVGLKMVFESIGLTNGAFTFIRYFLIGLWLTAGAPYAFKRFLPTNK